MLIRVSDGGDKIKIVTIKLNDDDYYTLEQDSIDFANKNGIKPNRSNYIRHLIRRAT